MSRCVPCHRALLQKLTPEPHLCVAGSFGYCAHAHWCDTNIYPTPKPNQMAQLASKGRPAMDPKNLHTVPRFNLQRILEPTSDPWDKGTPSSFLSSLLPYTHRDHHHDSSGGNTNIASSAGGDGGRVRVCSARERRVNGSPGGGLSARD